MRGSINCNVEIAAVLIRKRRNPRRILPRPDLPTDAREKPHGGGDELWGRWLKE